MRTIIVGHGNSVFENDFDIDSYDTVIRLKQANTGGTLGTKTTAIVACKPHWHQPNIPFWLFCESPTPHRRIDKLKWLAYFFNYKPSVQKPSNGLVALFAVKEFLGLDEVTVAGFDVMRDLPEDRLASHNGGPPFKWWHDFRAERRAADDLLDVRFL